MSKIKDLLPYFLIIAFALAVHKLCLTLSSSLFSFTPFSGDERVLLKGASGVVGLFPSLILIAASRIFSVEAIIRTLYLFALAAIFFGFFLLLPNADSLALPKATFQNLSFGAIGASTSELLANNWLYILCHSLLSLWSSGMLILLYGHANERFSFNEALSIYPLFGAAAVAVNVYITPLLPPFFPTLHDLTAAASDHWFAYSGLSLLLLSSAPFLLHLLLFRRGGREREEPKGIEESELGYSYASLLGITAGFSALLIMFTRMVVNYSEELAFPISSDYQQHLASFGFYENIASLMTLAILLFMSSSLKFSRAKGWRNIYFSIASVTLVLGCCFYFFNIFDEPLKLFLSPDRHPSPLSSVSMISAGYQILISSVSYPIVLSLKEIAIVPIKKSIRFTAKLLIDLLFVKGFLVVGMFTFQSTLLLRGSFASALPIIAAIFLLICIVRFIAIAHLGRSLGSVQE